jgi:hypothetical protein
VNEDPTSRDPDTPSQAQPDPGPGGERPDFSEEELRAQLEEELKRITVRDVLVQTVVSLINLAGSRLGLGEAGQEVRDLDQVRMAIDAVRALLPLVEEESPEQVKPVRDALTQLQMVYAREVGAQGGSPPGGGEPGGGEPGGGGQPTPGPQQRRGEPGGLWVPPGTAT